MIEVKVQGTIPGRATNGAAAYDLRARRPVRITSGDTVSIATGTKVALPPGFCGLVCTRSGLALYQSVQVLNAPGIIDSDFRGQICVILHNHSLQDCFIEAGQRIAQLLIVPCATDIFWRCEELDKTERGENGFGSTGKH